MKLQQLRYLAAIAEEGSILQASRKMGIAQPALTQQLVALEESLGTKLVHRSARGSYLTQSGKIMLTHARSILAQVDLAVREVQEQRSVVSGEIFVMVANAVAEKVVPVLLKEMAEHFPLVKVHIDAQDSGSVQSALENARIDFGILPEHKKLLGINSQTLFKEPMHFVSALTDADLQKHVTSDEIDFAQALRAPLIVVEKSNPLRQIIEEIAEERNSQLNIAAESNSLLMIRSYVESGAACCILPRCSVSDKVKLGQMLSQKVVDPAIEQTYLVAWPKSRPLARASEAAKTILNETNWEIM